MFSLTALPDGFHTDPYPTYAALREDTPVCWQPDGSVVLSRYDDLDLVYRDTERFISDKKAVFGPKYGIDSPLYEHHTTSLVFNDPPLHTRVRKVMVGAMNPRALAQMEPGLIQLVDGLLDEMQAKGSVELIEDFAGAIPIEIIGNLLGIPRSERGPLRDWSLAILGALEPQLTPEQEEWGNRSVYDFKDYLRHVIEDRRANPGDPATDVLTRLMQDDTDGGLTEVELYQNCIFILNAGHETTTNLIGNALELLERHRDKRAELLANPDLINTAVDEFLRLESPNQFGNRLTTEDVMFHGQTIPAGTDIHLCIGAANRDPRQFAQPDEVVLDRRPNKHHAFAGGPHTCVGLTLARMEGRVAVGRFLARFPTYRITDGAERGGRIRFRGFARLPAQV
ncbi:MULTISPECIES: cytochrome P450 [unclassified Ruegeria]|uniref:cytochrome P450 n=1 Tax=unclassified Ruegeria TaxID=2625375 RepID=UPI001492A31C|nr:MULTISPECIES: cytochrome P450 [unclassified Ruegeria]NOC82979.1 cytochrome P450 [Ruegeria sp. HKCCD6428]NOC92427.1 cytochrome P450 [Ruegeria sp. HKCCD6604]